MSCRGAGQTGRVLTWTVIETPVDELLLTSADGALRSIWFSPHKAKRTTTFVEEMTLAGGVRDDDEPVLVGTATQLGEYFAGERREFDLPLAPAGTRLPAAGLGGAAHHPVRRDLVLRRAGRLDRQGTGRLPGRRSGQRRQPDLDRRARATG